MIAFKKYMLFGFYCLIICFTNTLGVSTISYAADPLDGVCSQFPNSDVCTQRTADPSGDKIGGSNGIFNKIISAIIYLTASVSVLMVILGAFKYVTSQGDAAATKSAKDTIMYALIGLFVAISAFVIIRFVIAKL